MLVTTTIIENGLDIPRANTIIVNRADRFGLAQLYQLRGRVGRSQQHAYAYFVIPAGHVPLRATRASAEGAAGVQRAGSGLSPGGRGPRDPRRGGVARIEAARAHRRAGLRPVLPDARARRGTSCSGEPVGRARSPRGLHLGHRHQDPGELHARRGRSPRAVQAPGAGAHDEAEVDRLQAETEDRFGHLPARRLRTCSTWPGCASSPSRPASRASTSRRASCRSASTRGRRSSPRACSRWWRASAVPSLPRECSCSRLRRGPRSASRHEALAAAHSRQGGPPEP